MVHRKKGRGSLGKREMSRKPMGKPVIFQVKFALPLRGVIAHESHLVKDLQSPGCLGCWHRGIHEEGVCFKATPEFSKSVSEVNPLGGEEEASWESFGAVDPKYERVFHGC